MNDLISRKAAIELIKDHAYPIRYGFNSKGQGMNIEGIETALNIVPTAKQWTPCSERLPNEEIDEITKDYKEYLCVRYVGNERQVVSVYKFGKGAWWNGLFKVEEPFPVIAWQPLPEPYVEVEE